MKRYIALIILFMISIFLVLVTRFDNSSIVANNGYVITDSTITDVLVLNNENKNNVDLMEVKEDDSFWSYFGKTFIDKDYSKEVNTKYPLYTNDGLELINLSDSNKIINDKFERFTIYENFRIINGTLYGPNSLDQIDEEKYIFLELIDYTYINLFPVTVNTNTETFTIPLNSIISFRENEIKYYVYEKDTMVLKNIEGIDVDNSIIIDTNTYSYYDVLVNFDVIDIVENNDKSSSSVDLASSSTSDETSNNQSSNVDPGSGEIVEIPYVKPEVKCIDFVANVYSATSELSIYDPAGRITNGISFQIAVEGRNFLRKTFYNYGEIKIIGLMPSSSFKITGTYKFLNEENKKIEVTFYEGKYNTSGVDTLKPIELSFKNSQIYSDKIEINDIKIVSDINDEAINGLTKGKITINNTENNLSTSLIKTLTAGSAGTYTSPTNVESNTIVDYKITLYDNFGNEIKTKNNSGTTRTAMAIPTANVSLEKNAVEEVIIKITPKNPDGVKVANYRYVIVDDTNAKIKSGELDINKSNETIDLTDLNPNTTFSVMVYGDYDILDGNGGTINNVIGSTKFTTKLLSSLGYIRDNLIVEEMGNSYVKLSLEIDTKSVSPILISLLKKMSIKITDVDGNIVQSHDLVETDIETIKSGESITIEFYNLLSSTEYGIEISSEVQQGTWTENIQVLFNLKSFKTYRKDAFVSIINLFTNSNIIDFDAKLTDADGAIESSRVLLEIRDNYENLISMQSFTINGEYESVNLTKLDNNKDYYFIFKAEEYNIGYDNSTFDSDHIILKKKITTNNSVDGTIILQSLLKTITSENLFDIDDFYGFRITGNINNREVNRENNEITFSARNGYVNQAYYLPECANKTITVSFKAKYANDSSNAPAFISNGTTTAQTFRLTGLSTTYQDYTTTFKLNSVGYVGFLIYEAGNANHQSDVTFKDIKIVEGSAKSGYSEYSEKDTYRSKVMIDLVDSTNLLSDGTFYVNIYENGNLKSNNKFQLNGNSVTGDIQYFELTKNKEIKFSLVIKVRDRDYEISSLELNTNEQIRSLTTPIEFRDMHSYGKYIVLNDLDFTQSGNYYYSSNFYGEVDFQGHKLIYSSHASKTSYLIHTIASSAHIYNMNIEFHANNQSGRSWYYGLFYQNFGTVDNFMVTVVESNQLPNYVYTVIGYVNYGRISNFVFNSKEAISCSAACGLITWSNQGYITDGYLYGKNMNATFLNSQRTYKDIGVVAGSTSVNSIIKNVFSLLSVDIGNDSLTSENKVGNIVGNGNIGTLKNSFSVDRNSTMSSLVRDPNYGTYNVVTASNLFYISDAIYSSAYSIKASKMALYDPIFHNQTINADNQFIVDDLVSLGYYPHVVLNDCLPNQEWIKMDPITDTDLVDITTIKEISTNGDSSSIMFYLNNPAADTISEIGIKSLSNRIISQKNSNGKTELLVEVFSPTEYISKYSVMSISSIGVQGIITTRKYKEFEKEINLVMYKPIYTVQDFKNIRNNYRQNYMLMADLDFTNFSDYQINSAFYGVLNGNGHTIKNIKITSGSGLINSVLYGKITNLYIENFVKTNNTSYGGFIYQLASGSVVDNVHMKGVNVAATVYLGGLIAYGNYGTIQNCSVTNFTSTTIADLTDIRIGALAGYLYSSIIENCHATNVNIDISNAQTTYGVGGLVGYLNSGVVDSVFASGKITANSSYVGGITGYNAANISRAITNVEIRTTGDFVGGIVGKTSTTAINNTLVVGSVYSTAETTYLHRTIGGYIGSSSDNTSPQDYYVWDKQAVNGYITSSGFNEVLISEDVIFNPQTYIDLLDFESENFDFSGLENKVLPKIKYSDRENVILPNQIDSKLIEEEFNISDIEIESSDEDAQIYFIVNNPNNYNVTSVEIDGLEITEVKSMDTQNGQTIVSLEAKPIRYYDNYTITNINYIDNSGQNVSYDKYAKLQLQFFKKISNYEGWQSISKSTSENYILTQDIDFEGKAMINYNTVINRLRGLVIDGHVPTLKNLTYTFTAPNNALIRKLDAELTNVNFDNIELKIANTNTGGNYLNIIEFCYGKINNSNFNEITINTPKISYVAPIGSYRGLEIKNINITNMNITGNAYVSGFIGYSFNSNISDINVDTVTIVSNSNYSGSAIAYKEYYDQRTVFRVYGNNINITGYGRCGGLFGYGAASYGGITNSIITNTNSSGAYIGGYGGQASQRYADYIVVENVVVKSAASGTGGLFGWAYYVGDSYVDGCSVLSTNSNTGGAIGYMDYELYSVGVIDTDVIGTGSKAINVGGLVGNLIGNPIRWCFTDNVNVYGYANVGGMAGASHVSRIYQSVVNANVTAQTNYAGGMVGYAFNMDLSNTSISFYGYEVIIENCNITANNYVGGVFGYIPSTISNSLIYKVIFTGNIKTLASGKTSIGFVSAFDENFVMSLPSFYLYEYSTLYDENHTSGSYFWTLEGKNLTESTFIKSSDLKNTSFYSSTVKLTGAYFKYVNPKNTSVSVANGYFPVVRYDSDDELIRQTGIKLPTAGLSAQMYGLARTKYHELPNVKIYSSGIDKLNIEFDKADSDTTIELICNGKSIIDTEISKRVYTIYYDYKTKLTLNVKDGVNNQVYDIKPNDVIKTIGTNESKYVYIKDNKLYGNINTELIKDKNQIHIYGNKLLDDNGDIYDYIQNNYVSSVSEISLTETTPLYEFDYNDYHIKTYYNYSVITMNGTTTEYDDQVLIGNNVINIVDNSFENKKDQNIVDTYGGNEYLTVLGNDGIIYNLKTPIKYPEKFTNCEIKNMTNSINSANSIVIVQYTSGKVVVFNYRTGVVLNTNTSNNNMSLKEYISKKISNINNDLLNDTTEQYNKAKKLEQKLSKTNIIKNNGSYIVNEGVNNSDTKYITYYDVLKDNYVIAKEDTVLSINDDKNEIDKIYTNNDLMDYYFSKTNYGKKINNSYALIIYGIILSGIVISLLMWIGNMKIFSDKENES